MHLYYFYRHSKIVDMRILLLFFSLLIDDEKYGILFTQAI